MSVEVDVMNDLHKCAALVDAAEALIERMIDLKENPPQNLSNVNLVLDEAISQVRHAIVLVDRL